MTRYDRLSALFAHFALSVTVAPPGSGNLIFVGRAAGGIGGPQPSAAVFFPRGRPPKTKNEGEILLELEADLGGAANPLFTALPRRIALPLAGDDDNEQLVRLLFAEASAERCGFGSVLSRLAEVLVIRLLRHEIERGAAAPGLLAGLADARISRSIVAIHEAPERDWRNEELAALAGLSLSRFAELFRTKLEETPQAYLCRWRMTLARQDITRGDRIKVVSRRYGYGSSEAFAKAFQRHFGRNPLEVRREAA